MTDANDEPPFCYSFHPGHNIHWIQGRHVAELDRYLVSDLSVDVESGWVTFVARGEAIRKWVHNARYIPAILAQRPGFPAYWNDRYRVLFLETEGPMDDHGRTSAMFYLASEENPCAAGTVASHPLSEIRVTDDDSHRIDD